jgi:outer membrane translocation and assembly module TamA
MVFTPWPRHTLEPNWSLVSSLNTAPPLTQVVFLGGYPGMLGYAFEEFFGNEMARLQLLYRYRLTERIYLQAAGNLGHVWDTLDQWESTWDRMRWGGGGGVAFDTPLGPLAVTMGFGEQGRTNFYFNFGYGF